MNKKKFQNFLFQQKKGQIFHWIAFGVLFAIVVFIVASKSFTVSQELVGKWQVNFLENTVHEAQIDLLNIEQTQRNFAWETILEMADKGGMIKESECGVVAGENLWNKEDKWCIKRASEIAEKVFSDKSKGTNFEFSNTKLLIKGKIKTIEVPGDLTQKYNYSTSAAINLGYSFDDYRDLELEAQELVQTCKSKSDTVKCVQDNKKENWKFCGTHTNVFCVDSPNKYKIRGNLVVYQLALDFN